MSLLSSCRRDDYYSARNRETLAMLTHDEQRKECINVMAVGSAESDGLCWSSLGSIARISYLRTATAALNSLHGIAFVNWAPVVENVMEMGLSVRIIGRLWRALCVSGDLTKGLL